MKSFIVSLIIAAILLIGSILYTFHMVSLSDNLYSQTQNIYELIEQEQFREAKSLTDELTKHLDSKRVILAATGNHDEIKQIEISLNELNEFITSASKPDALAKCKSLGALFQNLPRNYHLRAENIL